MKKKHTFLEDDLYDLIRDWAVIHRVNYYLIFYYYYDYRLLTTLLHARDTLLFCRHPFVTMPTRLFNFVFNCCVQTTFRLFFLSYKGRASLPSYCFRCVIGIYPIGSPIVHRSSRCNYSIRETVAEAGRRRFSSVPVRGRYRT